MINAFKFVAGMLLLVCAFMLLTLGGLTFFGGDMALHDFAHFRYLSSEIVGVVAGLILTGMGFVLGILALETIKGRRSSK